MLLVCGTSRIFHVMYRSLNVSGPFPIIKIKNLLWQHAAQKSLGEVLPSFQPKVKYIKSATLNCCPTSISYQSFSNPHPIKSSIYFEDSAVNEIIKCKTGKRRFPLQSLVIRGLTLMISSIISVVRLKFAI